MFLDIDKCKNKNPPCEGKLKCQYVTVANTTIREYRCRCYDGFHIDEVHNKCKGQSHYFKPVLSVKEGGTWQPKGKYLFGMALYKLPIVLQ